MRYAAKVDANHRAVVDAFEQLGCNVLDLAAVGKGCPDLLVLCRSRLGLVEIKDGDKVKSAQKLTPQQVAFHERWQSAPLFIVRTLDDVGEVVRILGSTSAH